MGLFLDYLKSQCKIIGAFLGVCLIFAVVFALYELPVEAVGYGAVICVFGGLILVAWDYGVFQGRHQRLEALRREITVTAAGLPQPWGPLEEDYQAVIRVLYEDKLQLTGQMRQRYTDLVEYYTVWAHQIKTPIAAMGLLLQGEVVDTPYSRELREELQCIEHYVEMVLCYLRLEAPATDYLIREYDLDSIVKQAVRTYASQFIRRKIRLEYEHLGCRVLTDEKWLLFVIEQILSNALKYTRSGTIAIILEEPKTLCIRDTGMGIAPEDLPRIFEKGYTGFNGRIDKRASGIGLYLCRRICCSLGHKIAARSAAGGGTEIRIGLERAELQLE